MRRQRSSFKLGSPKLFIFMKVYQCHALFINVTGLNNCLSVLKSGLRGKLLHLSVWKLSHNLLYLLCA